MAPPHCSSHPVQHNSTQAAYTVRHEHINHVARMPGAAARSRQVAMRSSSSDDWLQQAAQQQAQKLTRQFEQLQQSQLPAMLEAAAAQHQRIMQELTDPARGMQVSQRRLEEIARVAARRVEQQMATRGRLDPAVLSLSRGLGRIGETVDDISARISAQYASNPDLFKSLYEEFLQEQQAAPPESSQAGSNTSGGDTTARPGPAAAAAPNPVPRSTAPPANAGPQTPPVTQDSNATPPGMPVGGVQMRPGQATTQWPGATPAAYPTPAQQPVMPTQFPAAAAAAPRQRSPVPPAVYARAAGSPAAQQVPVARPPRQPSPVRPASPETWAQQQQQQQRFATMQAPLQPVGMQPAAAFQPQQGRPSPPPPGAPPVPPAQAPSAVTGDMWMGPQGPAAAQPFPGQGMPAAAQPFPGQSMPARPVQRDVRSPAAGQQPVRAGSVPPVPQQPRSDVPPMFNGYSTQLPPAAAAAGGQPARATAPAPHPGLGQGQGVAWDAGVQQGPAPQYQGGAMQQGQQQQQEEKARGPGFVGWDDADARVVGWTVAVDKQKGRLPTRRRGWWGR